MARLPAAPSHAAASSSSAPAAAASSAAAARDSRPPAADAPPPVRRAATPRRLRRRFRSPAIPSGGGGGRRSGPATPSVRWAEEKGVEGVSVRRLAAALWQLRPPEASGSGRREFAPMVGVEHVPRHLQVQLLKHNTVGYHSLSKNDISSPISVLDQKNTDIRKMQFDAASTSLPAALVERSAKWEPENAVVSDDAFMIANHLNLLDAQNGTSFTSNLQLELQQAREKLSELESERRSSKKKMEQFLKKLSEDKAAWRAREHEKVRTVIDDMKAELEREKKSRRRLEMLNSKLVAEIKEAKMTAKQAVLELEKERKARELIEEVCNELAKEVEDDKAEIEALKQESLKLRDEVDEERKMLQMAEVWREERVQMKLVDAKLTLDSKYAQLSRLQHDVDAFLRSQKSGESEAGTAREAKAIMHMIDAVRAHEIEFTYDPPPPSEDIMAIFEELCPKEEPEIKEIAPCYKRSPAVQESEIHEARSPATDLFLADPGKAHSSRSLGDESETEEGSSWETISQEDMLRSSISIEGSEASVNKICDRNNSGSSHELENGKLNDDLDGAYPASTKHQKKSAISRLWKSSRPKNNNDLCKKDSAAEVLSGRASLARSSVCTDIYNGRDSNARPSVGTYSPEAGGILEVSGFSPPSIDHWSSPDSVGTGMGMGMGMHFTRGLRGCMECPPRGAVHKQSLKAKLMEARTESQKVQLRHVLKQKM